MLLRERRLSGSRRAETGTGSSFKCAYIIINVFVVPVAAIIVAAAPVVVVVRSALNVRTLRVFPECGRTATATTATTSVAATTGARESTRQEQNFGSHTQRNLIIVESSLVLRLT